MGRQTNTNPDSIQLDKLVQMFIPVVPHKAVAEVSK